MTEVVMVAVIMWRLTEVGGHGAWRAAPEVRGGW
jgi:hypothetical protein